MDKYLKQLGNFIKKERKKRLLTQTDLANLSEVSVTFIVNIERGKTSAEVGKLLKVLSVLGVQLNIGFGKNIINIEGK